MKNAVQFIDERGGDKYLMELKSMGNHKKVREILIGINGIG